MPPRARDGKGYLYGDERFTALSEIASRITGAKWSGASFFGLASRESAPPLRGRTPGRDGVVLNRRCAIYPRTSTAEGLEQDFNSPDAQHEACAAYITGQRHEGSAVVPDI